MTATTPERVESASNPATKASVPTGGTAPVLVVDDSAVARRLAGGLIQRGLGRPVIYAENGHAALEAIARDEPCIVLTDLQMEEMNGLELVEAIRVKHPQIPVVLMTAFGSEDVAMQALKAGAANYVAKSGLAKHLVDTLQQVCRLVDTNHKRRKILGYQTRRHVGYSFENDPDLISPLISVIQEDLISFNIGDETTHTRIGVALQESLANALFHGNLECSTDLRQEDERVFYRLAAQRRDEAPYRSRRIRVEAEVDATQARFVITDEGPGFNVDSLNKPFDPEDLLRIGGRGMLLIRTFMDEVVHNATGNQITLTKYA